MKPPFSDQDFESIRRKAYALRHNYFDDMEKYLLNLEAALQRKGLDVLWIKDRDSLTDSINSLVGKLNVRRMSFDTEIPFEPVFQNRAEIVPFETLAELGSMNACKEKGLVRSEGKDYVMKDGDITLFRFNV